MEKESAFLNPSTELAVVVKKLKCIFRSVVRAFNANSITTREHSLKKLFLFSYL